MKCVACGCVTRGKRVGPTLYAICERCDAPADTPQLRATTPGKITYVIAPRRNSAPGRPSIAPQA